MNTLPRAIHPAAFKLIAQKSEEIERKATEAGGEAWEKYQAESDMQRSFLEHFKQSFHVGRSLIKAGIQPSMYTRWRSTSIQFVQAFNQIIDDWHEDIYISAATRARGHRFRDEETESGYKEDADGNILHFDVDSKMQQMFLKAMYPEFNEKVDLNVSGGMANTTRVIKVNGVKSNPRPEPEPKTDDTTSGD